MGKKRGPIWDHFDGPFVSQGHRQRRLRCKHCSTTVSENSRNLSTHIRNCKSVSESAGSSSIPSIAPFDAALLQPDPNVSSHATSAALSSSNAVSTPPPSFRSRQRRAESERVSRAPKSKRISEVNRLKLDEMFTTAMNETLCSFSLFEHPAWKEFWETLPIDWFPPSEAKLATTFFEKDYEITMNKVFSVIIDEKDSGGGVISLDGDSNSLSRSVSNVMFYSASGPFLIECLRGNLKQETVQNLVVLISGVLQRLEDVVGYRCWSGFVSRSSSNAMMALRQGLVDSNLFTWEYGCSQHLLNNLITEFLSMDRFKFIMKKCVFLSKSFKNDNALLKTLKKMCIIKLGRAPARLSLFSSSSPSSANVMLSQLLSIKTVFAELPNILMYERDTYRIDTESELPLAVRDIIMDEQYWKDTNAALLVLDPICNCLSILESPTSTMSSAYACVLYVRIHISECLKNGLLMKDESSYLLERIDYRWSRIYSPVHALAFRCDPLFHQMIDNIPTKYGAAFLDLGKGDFSDQCMQALRVLSRGDQAHHQALELEFMKFVLSPSSMLNPDKESYLKYRPHMLWALSRSSFPTLAPAMVEVFKAPSGTSEVIYNPSISGAADTKKRFDVCSRNAERQISILHNRSVLRSRASHQEKHKGGDPFVLRDQGFLLVIACIGTDAHNNLLADYLLALAEESPEDGDGQQEKESEQNEEDLDEATIFKDDDQKRLFNRVRFIESPMHITDEILFPNSSEDS